MNPLVSIMIPTRKRPEGLCATVTNLVLTASAQDFEILIRYDDDDEETEIATAALKGIPQVRLFRGPRLGYAALDSGYFAGLENEAAAHFVWIGGDDMLVYGDWLKAIREAPRFMRIIQPAISRLGWSAYQNAEAQAFPIFPKHCWKAYVPEFPRPFDTAGDAMLKSHGWATHFLTGVTFHHNEASTHKIAKHRA